jgi:hypothetical protein
MTNHEVKAQIVASMEKFAMPPDAIARAIAFAIERPADIDVGEIIVRPLRRVSFALCLLPAGDPKSRLMSVMKRHWRFGEIH